MSDFRAPDERDAEIIRKNKMNPDEYGVILRGESFLLLLCYASRCTVRIDKGDRPWT